MLVFVRNGQGGGTMDAVDCGESTLSLVPAGYANPGVRRDRERAYTEKEPIVRSST